MTNAPPEPALWIAAGQIPRLVSCRDLIEALRGGFRRGACTAPRIRHAVDGEDGAGLFAMMAWQAGVGRLVKVMSATPSNAGRGLPTSAETVSLFDPVTGVLLAMVEAAPLTALRTAAASALVAEYLAPTGAEVLAVMATGPLAPLLALAHAEVRPLRRIVVWGRNERRAAATAAQIGALLPGVELVSTSDARAAVAEADVVSTATRATVPILRGAWLKPRVHVDLVGGYLPEMRESDDAVMAGAAIWLDHRPAMEAGDIAQPLQSGAIRASDIRGDLRDLVCGPPPAATGRSVFKSVGCALEDLYAARCLYDRARQAGAA